MADEEKTREQLLEELKDLRLRISGLESWNFDLEQMEAALLTSEVRFYELFNNMSSGVTVYQATADGQDFIIMDMNKAGERITRVNRDDVIGKTMLEVFPAVKEFGLFEVFQQVWSTGQARGHPISQYADERITLWTENYVYRLPAGEIVAVYDDVTEQRRAEQQIKKSLEEKEILLKEIHHRVKNNLQIISSLLSLQSASIKDEQLLEIFTSSQNRIKSMALIHEKLYLSGDLARIDFSDYVSDLAMFLYHIAGSDSVSLKTDIADVGMDISTAICCGLIVNELVSNSLKHAFPDGRAGEVCINLTRDAGRLKLSVSDDGIGLSETLDFGPDGSLGFQLVKNLAEQLKGSMELDRTGGTTCTITFTPPGDSQLERERGGYDYVESQDHDSRGREDHGPGYSGQAPEIGV